MGGSPDDYTYVRVEVQQITTLGKVQTAWFRGLFFVPAGIVTIFAMLAAGRRRLGRTIGYAWVISCLVAVLGLTCVDAVFDLTTPLWSAEQRRAELGEDAASLGLLVVICLVQGLIARSRSALGPAVVALLTALAGVGLHAVLLVRIWLAGVDVLAGPLAVGIMFVLLVAATIALLVAAAVEGPRSRRQRRAQASTRASSGASKLA